MHKILSVNFLTGEAVYLVFDVILVVQRHRPLLKNIFYKPFRGGWCFSRPPLWLICIVSQSGLFVNINLTYYA